MAGLSQEVLPSLLTHFRSLQVNTCQPIASAFKFASVSLSDLSSKEDIKRSLFEAYVLLQ